MGWQARHEVVPDATLRAAGTGGAVLLQLLRQSREALVKVDAARNNGIVAPTDEVDQPPIGDLLFVPIGWWHAIEALDVSASVRFGHFKWGNDFETSCPLS